jgi:hypothetical protein
MLIDILIPAGIVGALGAIFGAILAYASKKFHVEKDPKSMRLSKCFRAQTAADAVMQAAPRLRKRS